MAIIFGIFFGLFRALRLPRAVCGMILVPLIWFYVALTGWPASAIRATVMLTLVIGSWTLNRPTDLINSLYAAALLILLWEPQQLFQAGFQLSFFVVLCTILTTPPLYEWFQRLTAPDPLLPTPLHPRWRQTLGAPGRWLGGLAATSLAAWIGSLPLVACYFNIVTPVSTPANVLAVPVCGLVLVSNLASLLLAGWFPAAAELFNHAGWFLMECIRVSSHWFAHWPAAYLYVPAPSLFTTCLYYFVLLALVTGWLFQPKLRRCKFAVLGLLLACWCWQCWHECSVTRLSILPANGALAIYFDAPGSKSDLLIDCGSSNSVAFVTKPFLRAQGVNGLPWLLLTHGDLHHIGRAEIRQGVPDSSTPGTSRRISGIQSLRNDSETALQNHLFSPPAFGNLNPADRQIMQESCRALPNTTTSSASTNETTVAPGNATDRPVLLLRPVRFPLSAPAHAPPPIFPEPFRKTSRL